METLISRELIFVTKRPNRILIGQICFYIFWTIQMLSKGFAFDDGDRIYKILSVISLGFLAIKYLITDWDFKELVVACCLVFTGFMTYLMAHMLPMLMLALTLVGMKDMKIRPLLVYTFYLRAFLFLFMVSGSILGFVPERLLDERDYFDIFAFLLRGETRTTTIRLCLGYGIMNVGHINYLIVMLLYIYVRENKLNAVEYLSMAAANYILYRWTVSRTSMILVFLCLGISLLVRIRFLQKPVYLVGICSYFALLVVSVVLGFTYEYPDPFNPTLWQKICVALNSLFTARLEYNAYAVQSFSPFFLFGEHFQNDWSMLDSAILNLWLRFGIINCTLFFYGNTAYLIQTKRENRQGEFIALVGMIVLGFMEMSMYAISMNVFLLLLATYLYPSKKVSLTPESPLTRLLA